MAHDRRDLVRRLHDQLHHPCSWCWGEGHHDDGAAYTATQAVVDRPNHIRRPGHRSSVTDRSLVSGGIASFRIVLKFSG
jgi:hypothetical protein